MNAAALPPLFSFSLKRIAVLGLIALLHVAVFYLLQKGLDFHKEEVEAPTREVIATLISPAPEKPITTPVPPPPKPVVEKPAPKAPPHPAPLPKPAPNAITTPAPAPTPAPMPALPATPAPAAPATPVAPAPATPAPPAQPKTVSGVEYLVAPQPEYPPTSRRLGEEGKATLRVLVNVRGIAERAEVVKSSGSPRLDEAARQAVLRARFKPYMEDGKAIAVFVSVPINFQLD